MKTHTPSRALTSFSGIVVATTVIFLSAGAFAAPTIGPQANVNVTGNTAKNVTTGGGNGKVEIRPGGFKVGEGEVNMTGVANVNSLVIKGDGEVNGTVSIVDNVAEGINAIGGTANVNSVVLTQ